MNELTPKWKQIFDEISLEDDHIKGTVNFYNLTSILEDLYVKNAELKSRVGVLEKRLLENDLNLEGCYD